MIRAAKYTFETRYYEAVAANGTRMYLRERIRVMDVSGANAYGYTFAIVAEREVFPKQMTRIPELASYWVRLGEFARSHVAACKAIGGEEGKYCPVFDEQEFVDAVAAAYKALGWK